MTSTSPMTIVDQAFPGGGGSSGAHSDVKELMLQLKVDQSFVIPADRFANGGHHWAQVMASSTGSSMGRKFRTRRQPNGDLGVYRVG